MKWFKHNGNTMQDEKIEEIILEFGMEGYGVYFGIIEMIAGALSNENICFDLKHRATVLERKFNIKRERIIKITNRLVDIGLLHINPETKNIACFGLLKRLDVSTSNNPEFKKMINNSKYQKLLETISRREENTIEKNTRVKEENTMIDEMPKEAIKPTVIPKGIVSKDCKIKNLNGNKLKKRFCSRMHETFYCINDEDFCINNIYKHIKKMSDDHAVMEKRCARDELYLHQRSGQYSASFMQFLKHHLSSDRFHSILKAYKPQGNKANIKKLMDLIGDLK